MISVLMVATTVFSFQPGTGWGVLLDLWLVLGAGTSAIFTPSARVLRDATDGHTGPGVFTAHFSLSHACFIPTHPVAGWVGAQAGLRAAPVSWPRPTRPPGSPRLTPQRSPHCDQHGEDR